MHLKVEGCTSGLHLPTIVTMELRVVILTVACFSCLLTPAFCTVLLAAKGVAAAIAAKGAILNGVAQIAGGVAENGAALLAAKGAALRGAGTLAAKGAALGSALLTAPPRPVLEVHKPLIVRQQFAPIVYSAPRLPTVSDKLSSLASLWGVVQASIEKKTSAAADLLDALRQKVLHPKPVPSVIYDVYYQNQPEIYQVPVVEQVVDC